MRRRLSTREVTLLIILVLLVLISSYYLWFYVPTQEKKTALENEILDTQMQIEIDQSRVVKLENMRSELEEIFAENPNPVSMAPYDNSPQVMAELHRILGKAEEYSLDFMTADNQDGADYVRRQISLQYQSRTYDEAKAILRELGNSEYRCMLDDLTLSDVGGVVRGPFSADWETYEHAGYRVSASLVFFEYVE